MDKLKIKQGIFFLLEISLFMFTGIFLFTKDWVGAVFIFLVAMVLAVITGELIKQDAIREYKQKKSIK